jgi:hypothetical protein
MNNVFHFNPSSCILKIFQIKSLFDVKMYKDWIRMNHQDRSFLNESYIVVNLSFSNIAYSFSMEDALGKRWKKWGGARGGGIPAFRPNVSTHQFKAWITFMKSMLNSKRKQELKKCKREKLWFKSPYYTMGRPIMTSL